jgi:predicted TIM-barrel fold metal-dependent hydrolase
MIIDCHTHISCPEQEVDVEVHRAACQAVDRCFVLAGCDLEAQEANQRLSEYIEGNSKAVGFAVVNPLAEEISRKTVKGLLEGSRFRGIVLYCAEDQFHPAHSQAMGLYEVCEEMGVPVFFHNCPPYSPSAVLDYARPWLLDEVARTFPGLKIIVGRMGLPFLEQTLCLLSKHEHLYADLTIHPVKVWQVYNTVLSAYEAGVMDKLLFGSGFPYATAEACIETLLGFNKLFSDVHLPQVPREKLRSIVERDSLGLLGLA